MIVTATLTNASSLGSTGKLTLVPGQFKVQKPFPENHPGVSLGISRDQVSLAVRTGHLEFKVV